MEVHTSPPAQIHAPQPGAKRPKGILKNSFQGSPPTSPIKDKELTDKELVIQNTQANAGHRRSSSAASRPAGSRRQSSRTPSNSAEDNLNQRLKWDEANLYLTEQERSSTMKITEPKTPYAKHYEPSEDDDDDYIDGSGNGRGEDIPNLNLGEPEEELPEGDFEASRRQSKVHVSDEDATPQHDGDNPMLGLTPEEQEKHRRFEQLRKKHYEMSEAVGLLGHPEIVDDELNGDDNDEGNAKAVPPMPKLPPGINGTS
ncbi:hypothetical protein BX600DRAFT_512470 [Xylariales sp. PMI_506]|nr:hypothetical protein BX600DRAFT_512470 [Xylariales sp. PMI_506]